ncbi:MAG: hypothetical protein U5N56_01060 [Candidatus Marinimicrobia bacterium]|nr:hypothetical protein [Candidatus Neomarinimicrobiota bacterium]
MIVKRTVLMFFLLTALFGFAFAQPGIIAEVEPTEVEGNVVNITIIPSRRIRAFTLFTKVLTPVSGSL